MSDSRKSVLIIGAHRLVREGLGALLSQEEDLRVVGMVADANQAIEILSELRPHVIILVHTGTYADCVADLQRIKASHPGLPALVVSHNLQPEKVQAALFAGAVGYLPLDADQDELIHAAYLACRGELTLHPTVVMSLLLHRAEQSNGENHAALEELSSREQEVLSCLARGLSDKDIAQALFLSVRTVQTHLAHVYAKLGVHSRIEAALMAVKAGWHPQPVDLTASILSQ
ncbi:MAG: response regulator transcription factor [Anaerolineales bacterium]